MDSGQARQFTSSVTVCPGTCWERSTRHLGTVSDSLSVTHWVLRRAKILIISQGALGSIRPRVASADGLWVVCRVVFEVADAWPVSLFSVVPVDFFFTDFFSPCPALVRLVISKASSTPTRPCLVPFLCQDPGSDLGQDSPPHALSLCCIG